MKILIMLKVMKKMMTAIVSIYELDKDTVSNYGEVVELVNSASYDGKYLYIKFAKISNVKMMRLEQGKSQKQVAEKMGVPKSTVDSYISRVLERIGKIMADKENM